MRFVLDPTTRLVDGGTVVLGGSPLVLFRLSPAGAAVARALADGRRLPAGHESLTRRLLAAGAIHPLPDDGDGPPASAAAAVIPTRDTDVATLTALVGSLHAEGVGSVTIVDDGSDPPIGAVPGATVHRLAVNQGPGAARNAGAATTTAEILVFLDDDTTPSPGWLRAALAHLTDERVGLVAPRITAVPVRHDGERPERRSRCGDLLARYEQWRSPLDLGPSAARIAAGSRVSYVPAAALVVRRAAFDAVGGFDETLRFGEDVDLVWRIAGAGWGCRYEPAATVGHRPRPTLVRWLVQRYRYGTSAAPLDERHPGALGAARVSGWSALSWGVGALVDPFAGVGIALATTIALARKLPPMRHRLTEAFRLAGRGNLFAGRTLAAAITRAWWPLAALAAVVSRRARRAVLAAALVPAGLDWWRDRPPIDPLRAVALHVADDVAYGAGVWAGVIRHRRIGPLAPGFTAWPPRRRRDAAVRRSSSPAG